MFELIEPGTYIRMRSPVNAIEPFFIAEVINKGVAECNIYDENERYAEIKYLQKSEQKRKFVQYQRPKKDSYLNTCC